MDILTTLLVMVFCLIAEGFFSGSEIGVVSADQMRLRHEAAKGSRGAKLALKILGSEAAADLAAVSAAAGLACNLAALRALATEGIQRGHMALHARLVARTKTTQTAPQGAPEDSP